MAERAAVVVVVRERQLCVLRVSAPVWGGGA